MLQELGMPMPLDQAAAIDALDALSFTFLFAPAYHPAMKNIMPTPGCAKNFPTARENAGICSVQSSGRFTLATSRRTERANAWGW